MVWYRRRVRPRRRVRNKLWPAIPGPRAGARTAPGWMSTPAWPDSELLPRTPPRAGRARPPCTPGSAWRARCAVGMAIEYPQDLDHP